MRGHVEESAEVRAKRNLLTAARRYAGIYLADPFGVGVLEKDERALEDAAVAFAATQPRPKKKRAA